MGIYFCNVTIKGKVNVVLIGFDYLQDGVSSASVGGLSLCHSKPGISGKFVKLLSKFFLHQIFKSKDFL